MYKSVYIWFYIWFFFFKFLCTKFTFSNLIVILLCNVRRVQCTFYGLVVQRFWISQWTMKQIQPPLPQRTVTNVKVIRIHPIVPVLTMAWLWHNCYVLINLSFQKGKQWFSRTLFTSFSKSLFIHLLLSRTIGFGAHTYIHMCTRSQRYFRSGCYIENSSDTRNRDNVLVSYTKVGRVHSTKASYRTIWAAYNERGYCASFGSISLWDGCWCRNTIVQWRLWAIASSG